MNSLRQIPLHMLFLAGLVAPLAAQAKKSDKSAPAAVDTSSSGVAYAGLNVGALSAQARAGLSPAVPAGLGILVGFVDPAGPAVNQIEEGDVLTRLNDQVLVNNEQFRTLIQMRKPGDVVKLTVVRGEEMKVVSLKLGERQVLKSTEPSLRAGTARSRAKLNDQGSELVEPNGTVTEIGPGSVVIIGPNHGLPPEVLKRLEEMRSRGLMLPGNPFATNPSSVDADEIAPPASAGTQRSMAKSFSFNFGSGVTSSSSSIATDAQGSVSLEEKDGKKHALIKDANGQVVFDGEVTTEAQRAAMPEEARRRLKLVDGTFSVPGLSSPPAAEDAAPVKPKKKLNPKEGA